ncbi:GIY-YIG nuclease family protein [bacterium]|nr:MAG: GIY-YIG nuclease family protein [bacterium]
MIFTYLLKSGVDGSYYTGIAENTDNRLSQHNAGKVKSTSSKKPWKLVYKKEHINYEEARKHEKWLKKKNHQYKDKLAGSENLPAWAAGL